MSYERLQRRGAAFFSRIGVEHGALVLPFWIHGVVLSAIGVVTINIARGLWGWTYDDVFIIFRYARNFADGLGMVYNPGEAYLGTSSIGYTLLLALMHKIMLGLDFLQLGSIISAVGLFATGALLWMIGVQTRAPLAGALAALITITNPVLVEVWGGEMYLLLPLVLASILSYSRGMGTLTGVLLGFAVLTRQDSLVLVAAITGHYLLTKRRLPVAGTVAFLIVVLPWLAYSWVFFGSPLPGTLDAKIEQGRAGWPFFLSGTIQWLNDRLGPGAFRSIVFLLIFVGGANMLFQWRKKPLGPWFLFLSWSLLFAAGYTALRVAFYGWYAVPAAVALGVLIAWGIAAPVELMVSVMGRALAEFKHESAIRRRVISYGLASVVLLLVALPVAKRVRAFSDNYIETHRQTDLYKDVGEWLAERGGPSVSAAYVEVGEIGYYSNSRVVDLLGLVTPGAAAHVPAWDYDWAVQRYRPDYYLAGSRFNPILQNIQQENWFTSAYEKVTTFEDHRKSDPNVYEVVVYKRKPDAELPAPLRPVVVQRVSQQPQWIIGDAPPDKRYGQTFIAPEANISAIALLVGKPPEATTGNLVLHLMRDPADTEDVRKVSAPLSEIANNGWYTFRFEPLEDSAGQSYYFTVELTGAPTDQPPPALWVATDDLYAGGSRYEGAKAAPGDVCMRVSVPDGR